MFDRCWNPGPRRASSSTARGSVSRSAPSATRSRSPTCCCVPRRPSCPRRSRPSGCGGCRTRRPGLVAQLRRRGRPQTTGRPGGRRRRVPRAVRGVRARPAGQSASGTRSRVVAGGRRRAGRRIRRVCPGTAAPGAPGTGSTCSGTALRWILPAGRSGRRRARRRRSSAGCRPTPTRRRGCGVRRRDGGLLQLVNGFYRASRGTFAQFGLPLPYPERVIDTVLRARRGPPLFAAAAERLQRARRRPPAVADARNRPPLATRCGPSPPAARGRARLWTDGQGFGFHAPALAARTADDRMPGLQGTEMWLAILWYLADLPGVSALWATARAASTARTSPAAVGARLIPADLLALIHR